MTPGKRKRDNSVGLGNSIGWREDGGDGVASNCVGSVDVMSISKY